MADLGPAEFEKAISAIAERIVSLTGLPREVADSAALSAIPPYDVDGDQIILTTEGGAFVAKVSEADLDPCSIIDSV